MTEATGVKLAPNLEWESAYSALKRFETIHLDRLAAKSTLADCLRDGELRARAHSVFEVREKKIHLAWNSVRGQRDDDGPFELDANTWRRSKDWAEDQVDWRWPRNHFALTLSKSPFKRELLKGIEFFREDMDRILRKRIKSLGGATKRDRDWTLFWHSVIDLAKKGKLIRQEFPSIISLRSAIATEMDEALSEDTIGDHVSEIWRKFIDV